MQSFVSPSVSQCLFVCYCTCCVMWRTNTTSASWRIVQSTFKTSILLHSGIRFLHSHRGTQMHSRAPFLSLSKKHVGLNLSARAYEYNHKSNNWEWSCGLLALCVRPQLALAPLTIWWPALQSWSSRCGCSSQPCTVSHTWFISCSYSTAHVSTHTHIQYRHMKLYTHTHECRERTLPHPHISTTHKHSQIKTRNQCNL